MNEASKGIESQCGTCGIVCSTCPLGSGTVAESAGRTKQFITDYKIAEWSPFVPEGKEIDWALVDRALDWMTRYTCCAGCENGGGPPDCTIRICARERGYDLCNSCTDLDSCSKFDWLKDHGSQMRATLKENRGSSKEEYTEAMASQMPWNLREP
ncbi:Uncharacterised protein [uncultured archaeon]|nr:Uncharacterised protein [uncultured archaeon]